MPTSRLDLTSFFLTNRHVRRIVGLQAVAALVRDYEGAHDRQAATAHDDNAESRVLDLGPISFALTRSDVRQRITVTRDRAAAYVCQFTLEGRSSYLIDNHEFEVMPMHGLIIHPNVRFERVREPGYSLALQIDLAFLRTRLGNLLRQQPVAPIAFRPILDTAAETILTMIRAIDSCLAQDLATPGDAVADAFQNGLIDLLLELQPHNYSQRIFENELRTKARRVDAIRERLEDDPAAQLTVEDLAAAAGCGVRSLQVACRELCHENPMAIARRHRLTLARARLRESASQPTIAQISHAFGFSSPAEFTRLYKKRYGERPSETVRSRADRFEAG